MPDVTIGKYILTTDDISKFAPNRHVRPTSGEWEIADNNYGEIEFRKGGVMGLTQADYQSLRVAFGMFDEKAKQG